MTWEEAVITIRKDPSAKELISSAYLDEDLELNTVRYIMSEEFQEVVNIINEYSPGAKTIIDIGAGNGISSIAFSKKGFSVIAVEPDTSSTVGSNAIKKLCKDLKIKNIEIVELAGENLKLDFKADVIYCRQVLHHAANLGDFLKNLSKHCKRGGLLLTTRDHVIFNKRDKEDFLMSHPLHKYYGGENAYKSGDYKRAIKDAGFRIEKILKHYDSVINYAPLSRNEFEYIPVEAKKRLRDKLHKFRLPYNRYIHFLFSLYKGFSWPYNEKKIKGRLYSFISIKE